MKEIDRSFFKSFIEKIPTGIAILDDQYRYLIVNQSLAEINGMKVNDIEGKTIFQVVPHLADIIKPYIDEVLNNERDLLNMRVTGKTALSDMERHWKVDYKLLILPSASKAVIVSAEEITELISKELRLQNSKEYLRAVLDNLFAFVGVLTPDGTLTDANKAPLEAAGIEFDEVVNKKFWDCYWWSYDTEVQAKLKTSIELAAAGQIVRYDVPVRVADGETLPIDFMLAPLYDNRGNVINLIPSGIDISERKATEQLLIEKNKQLSHLLEEKTTLLNEVHHRVKNNLQVISSLLNLQGQFVDTETAEQFRMCQQRVRAMGLVHQLLYESEDLVSVNLKSYINKLAGLLTEGFFVEHSNQHLTCDFSNDEFIVEVKKMIPIAFIVTELLTNCLKHGVIRGGGKQINITLEKEGNNLVIKVFDDGPGFTEAQFFSSPSLGNKLIMLFSKQVKAEVSISETHPTKVTVVVPSVLS